MRASSTRQALGLEPLGAKPDGKFVYRCGGTELALFPKPEGTKAEHTALELSGGATSSRRSPRWSSAACSSRTTTCPGLKTVDHVCVLGSEKAAWFEDPEGNILCLHEDLA